MAITISDRLKKITPDPSEPHIWTHFVSDDLLSLPEGLDIISKLNIFTIDETAGWQIIYDKVTRKYLYITDDPRRFYVGTAKCEQGYMRNFYISMISYNPAAFVRVDTTAVHFNTGDFSSIEEKMATNPTPDGITFTPTQYYGKITVNIDSELTPEQTRSLRQIKKKAEKLRNKNAKKQIELPENPNKFCVKIQFQLGMPSISQFASDDPEPK